MDKNDDQSGGVGCGGGCLGALLFTSATLVCHQLLVPQALGDGQYVMIFFLTAPVGAAIGFVSANIFALKPQAPRQAALLALRWGLGVMGFLVLLTAGNASHWFSGSLRESMGFLFPLVGLPLLWSMVLAAWGVISRRK